MSTTTHHRREPRGVPTRDRPTLTIVPSSDRTFAQVVRRLASEMDHPGPDDLAARLRRLFPRVSVRVRQLADEGATWYVYRDGGWRRDEAVAWWREPRAPRVDVGLDGSILGMSPAARSLLGVETDEPLDVTTFVVPDAVADAAMLFEIVKEGAPVAATVRIRPLNGDIVAFDVHCRRRGNRLTAWLRLAEDIAPEPSDVSGRPAIVAEPEDDAVFAGYVADTLAGLSPASPAELQIRLHRLYPHARVHATGSAWLVTRDRDREAASPGDRASSGGSRRACALSGTTSTA